MKFSVKEEEVMMSANLNHRFNGRLLIGKLIRLLAVIFLGLCVANALQCGFFCRREYSVYKDSYSGERSIFPKGGSVSVPGLYFEKGNLCCEEAEALAGKPGACSEKTSGTTQ